MTHTPGPWTVEQYTAHDAAFRVMDEQDVTVALCYQQPYDTWSAGDNANLIAAAPLLLKQLEIAMEIMQDGDMDVSLGDDWAAFEGAVSKAKGE
jgi:hypothetical protein